MLALPTLVALVAAMPACALHIKDAVDMPNILTVPELQVPRPGNRRLAQLPAGHLHGLHHTFMGTTDVGFVEFNYSAVPKSTSIHAEDYDDVLSTATFTCAPVEEGAAPSVTPGGEHVRNDVAITIDFTSAAVTLPDFAHFAERMQAEGAYLTIDHSLHATHPSFGIGSACAEQIPFEASVYAVSGAALAGAALSLVLTPASARDAHHVLDVRFFWDPDTGRELSRRRSLGLATGVDARRRLRGRALPAVPMTGSGSLAMNYNGKGGATTATIDLLPTLPGALTCTNCYAFMAATYSMNIQFCTGVYEPVSGATTLYTSEKYDGLMGSDAWPLNGAPTWKSGTTFANLADCTASLAPWIAVSASASGGPIVNLGGRPVPATNLNGAEFTAPNALRTNVYNVFNSAYNIDASVGGTGGFGFQLTSKGLTVAGSTSTSCTGTDSSLCLASAVQISTPVQIPITIATGITATVTATVKGAAIWSGALPFTLSVGASALVGSASTPAKLGGRLAITDAVALASTCLRTPLNCLSALGPIPYTTYPLTYAATPASIALTGITDASLDATIWTTIGIKVFSDAVPITASAAVQFQGALTAGKARRSLGHAEFARMLDSATTCPRTGTYVTVNANALLGATAGPVTLQGVLDVAKIPMPSILTTPTAALLGLPTPSDIKILPEISISAQLLNPTGASQALVAACLSLNTPLTGIVGGPGSTPLTSTGGGAAAGSGSSGSGQSLDQGQIALIVIGIVPFAALFLYGVWRTLACSLTPVPPPPPPPRMGGTGSLDAYGDFKYGRPAAGGIYAASAFGSAVKATRSPTARGSPMPESALTSDLYKALPPPAFRMLKQKGALSSRGEVLKAVVLSEAEEASMSTELLVMLAEAGVVE